jgi:endonuclease/exonuclease/phosphatase family metal-dependent hydrolase
VSADTDNDGTLRVMTLNAHQGFGAIRRREALLRMRDALRASDADLVFLQEIGVAGGAGATSSQYEVLADSVWCEHAYGRNAIAAGGHHGNALLSKHPILDSRNIDASVGSLEPRGFLHCILEVPQAAAPMHAVCVHLALLESHRRRQVARLVELVAASVPECAPLVIAGDFNDWRGHAHRELTRALRLDSACRGADGLPPRTFPARWPLLRLDRIYLRNLAHRPVRLPRQPWSMLSDHAPLACEVFVTTPRSDLPPNEPLHPRPCS